MANWRINLIFCFFILFSLGILTRLFFIQIVQGDFYKALSQGFIPFPKEIQIERGEIFLKNKEPLALNKDFTLVFASPPKVKNPEEAAKTLSEILNLPEPFLLQLLKEDTLYSLIKNRLTDQEVKILKDLKLDGIYLTQERGRYYPKEEFFSQAIGFLGAERKGQYGLEEYYDQTLKAGRDLILTIDYNIQFEAEKLLKEAKENLEIEGGEIIVIDPNSGKILALANFPNFNPNQYQEYAQNLEIFKNSVTQKLFEPGSVFKPMVMAAGLDKEKITPQTTYLDPGKIKIDGWTIHNYDRRKYPGELTMTNVLEKSINTGAIFAENKVGHNLFLKYLEKFGIFERTDIDLPEIFSENKELQRGDEINFATASFGQGIHLTPIQLVRSYSAIANGGKLIQPYLVEKTIKGKKTLKNQPKLSEPILLPQTSSQLTAMLVSVVENGFARRAKIPGYYIAGKTGTAQVPFANLGINKPGYSDQTIQAFIGFFPAFSPQFLILVKLDNPQTRTAEYSAVPIFRRLAEYLIHQYQIPPDY